jgi:hypothetical protein
MEVIVVDNASTDDSAESIRTLFPGVRVLVNTENLGFTAGINQAFHQAKGENILVLHPDTVCQRGALRFMVEFLRNTPQAGIVGANNSYPNGEMIPSCFGFHTILTQFASCLRLDRLFRKNSIFGRYEITHWDHSTVREVDWVSYSCLMFRRQLLDQVGYWDEGFFVWVADEDFCYRARQKGWRTFFLPQAVIIHMERRSDQGASSEVQQVLEYKRKWYLVAGQMALALGRFQRKHRGLWYARLFGLLLVAEYMNRMAVWWAIRCVVPERQEEAQERVTFYLGALRTLLHGRLSP